MFCVEAQMMYQITLDVSDYCRCISNSSGSTWRWRRLRVEVPTVVVDKSLRRHRTDSFSAEERLPDRKRDVMVKQLRFPVWEGGGWQQLPGHGAHVSTHRRNQTATEEMTSQLHRKSPLHCCVHFTSFITNNFHSAVVLYRWRSENVLQVN